jgi:hypothetical protein
MRLSGAPQFLLMKGMILRRSEIAAMVDVRVDLARKPLRLRTSLVDLRNLAYVQQEDSTRVLQPCKTKLGAADVCHP